VDVCNELCQQLLMYCICEAINRLLWYLAYTVYILPILIAVIIWSCVVTTHWVDELLNHLDDCYMKECV